MDDEYELKNSGMNQKKSQVKSQEKQGSAGLKADGEKKSESWKEKDEKLGLSVSNLISSPHLFRCAEMEGNEDANGDAVSLLSFDENSDVDEDFDEDDEEEDLEDEDDDQEFDHEYRSKNPNQ